MKSAIRFSKKTRCGCRRRPSSAYGEYGPSPNGSNKLEVHRNSHFAPGGNRGHPTIFPPCEGSELVDQQIKDQAELLRAMSGVSVVDRGYRNSGTVNSVIIRGINVDNGLNGDIT